MPKFSVDVKTLISVEVEADSPTAAVKVAEDWVNWLSPTDEQLEDYLSDHDVRIPFSGSFAVDGDSDVEIING